MRKQTTPSVLALGLICVLAVGACGSVDPQFRAAKTLPDCAAAASTDSRTGPLSAADCTLTAGPAGQTRIAQVRFAPQPSDASDTGVTTIDIWSSDGRKLQTLTEGEVSFYGYPTFGDIDGDGHFDLAVPIAMGNVNLVQALYTFDTATNQFVRAGEVSGLSIERTGDGLLAVPSRDSAVSYVIGFYRLAAGTLQDVASVTVTAQTDEAGNKTGTTCALTEGPGIAALNLTPPAAEAKFCAEPAAAVFD